MDRLTLMRSFVGVTKSRSFSQPARTLGISGSLVSRRVAELVRDLGVRLVDRTRIWHLRHAGHDVHLKTRRAPEDQRPVYSCNGYLTPPKAASAGRGIGLPPVRLVSSEFTDGSLVDVMPGIDVPDRPLCALYSPGGQPPARVKAVPGVRHRLVPPPAGHPARQAKSARRPLIPVMIKRLVSLQRQQSFDHRRQPRPLRLSVQQKASPSVRSAHLSGQRASS